MPAWLRSAAQALLEVLLPARCLRCGGPPAAVSVERRANLRWCDPPQLCAACRDALLAPRPVVAVLSRGDKPLTVAAGRPTDAALVEIVAAWKYRGRRGLGPPLAALADAGWEGAVAAGGPVDALVPIPLHARRRRERGFNQAEQLARLLGRRRRVPVRTGWLVRSRATAQQAKLASRSAARDRNVAGAFALAGRNAGVAPRVGLVDDLVTSGATALAAAASLRAGGADVRWVLAAGLARQA
jgi:predicted amidophosphoribosyltransferase